MDAIPEYSSTSGARAPSREAAETRGLKPTPPEEERLQPVPQLKPIFGGSLNVGAKAPTSGAITSTAAMEEETTEKENSESGLTKKGSA
jgi:hypothetical protein